MPTLPVIYSSMKMTDFDNKFNELLERIKLNFVESLKDNLKSSDTNFLKANIKGKVVGNKIVITMPEYGQYIEFGTPGRLKAPKGMSPNPNRKMPVEKQGNKWVHYIKDWASRKLGVTNEKDLWGISKHIQLYGTKPHPFIRTTINKDLKSIISKSMIRTFR